MSVLINDTGSVRVGCLEPNEVIGLFTDIDMSKLTGYANTNFVPTLIDSIAGNDLIQPTSGNQFQYRTEQMNGYPSLYKDASYSSARLYYGNSNVLENLWSGDITVFLVVNLPVTTTPLMIMSSGVFNFSGGTGGFELLASNNQIRYRDLLAIEKYVSPPISYVPNANTVIVVNIKRSGRSYLRVNTSRAIMSANTPAYTQSIYDNIYLFSSPISTAGIIGPALFSQMLIYNRSLIAQEEGSVTRFLKFKWGAV